ncbi:uncharacterized protein PV09_08637 [Verruconis gallopava]|uniref:NmrA-like domain-containing protein n=1 Tax=Verruconis gallopava TaxID=253628 RepID=A0A0D1YG17_9PEZI|nr:uncharacterized protein PV09_08637 [Verruconis gallopava]KIV99706.1 hypothetical protein PV09_08637 [Verruconis gallopava]
MSNHIKNVAIVGAGGQIGSHIVRALVAQGKHNITAITREGSENQIPDGVARRTVNYENHASLVSALEGNDFLIVTLAVTAPVETSALLFKAAAEAKVPWVMPNLFGTDCSDPNAEEAIRMQFESQRSVLEGLGLSWVAIACSFWYEFSLAGTSDRYGFDFRNKKVTFYDDGETPIHTTTFPQVGRAVASLLALAVAPTDPKDTSPTLATFRNKFVHIASFRISQKDMFASVLRVTKTQESDWDISYENSKDRFDRAKAAMLSGDRIAFGRMLYARGFFPGDTNMCNFDRYGLDNKLLGLPEESLDEFTQVAVDMVNENYIEKKYAALQNAGGNRVAMALYGEKQSE